MGLFIQPDWFEVKQRGVGTNRYSYSFNDPLNKLDPNGNAYQIGTALVGGLIGVGFQGAIDLWSGELSSKEAYAAAFVGGAVTGATFGLMSPATSTVVKSVVSGGAGTVAGSVVENGELPSVGEVVIGGVIDRVTAGKGSKVVSNITAPRGGVVRTALSDEEKIGILREASDLRSGNLTLSGSASQNEARELGEAWVGPGHRVSSNGRVLISADGTRQYRGPEAKPNNPHSKTGRQANFERRTQRDGKWEIESNAHLDIND